MPEMKTSATEPRILLTGLVLGESPRWHEGRLWFSDWGAQAIIAVDLEGRIEVITRVKSFPSASTGWPMAVSSSFRRATGLSSAGSPTDHY